MRDFALRPKAVSDLEDIWDYTVSEWDEEQAERCLRMVNAAFVELACDPSSGKPCDKIREGYHRRRSGSHVIFYRVQEMRVEIVRVLHQSMDFGSHL